MNIRKDVRKKPTEDEVAGLPNRPEDREGSRFRSPRANEPERGRVFRVLSLVHAVDEVRAGTFQPNNLPNVSDAEQRYDLQRSGKLVSF